MHQWRQSPARRPVFPTSASPPISRRFGPRAVAEHVADFSSVRAVRYRSLLVTDPPERFFAGMNLSFDKIPQTWVIAPDGTVLRRIEGALTEESAAELVAFVEAWRP